MDLDLSVVITRNYLGLTPLELNDGRLYKAGLQFLGGSVSYARTQVGGPYSDGQTTTDRQLQMVSEPLTFEVFGRTNSNAAMTALQLQINQDALVSAFSQNSYQLTVTIDGAVYKYQGEASDYQLAWTGPRWMARQGQVTITMLRQPRPLVGVT